MKRTITTCDLCKREFEDAAPMRHAFKHQPFEKRVNLITVEARDDIGSLDLCRPCAERLLAHIVKVKGIA